MGGPVVTTAPSLPDLAWLVALAALDHMGPARLRALTDGRSSAAAWDDLRHHRAAPARLEAALGPRGRELLARWAEATSRFDVDAFWRRHVERGVGVVRWDSRALPSVLADDVRPPALLVWEGSLETLDGPRVALVGTRDCSRSGRDLAFELGRDLAAAGVRVVSGLALGIDGAAHAGALASSSAPPVAVVGTGVDVVYPRRNAALWRRVATTGVVMSEYPLGTSASAWRFPARNRLIAALADVVVVVESHEAGGALITVEEAQRRGREVMAVPGPVRSPASQGTNKLIYDGAHVCRDAADVLTLLGLDHAAATRVAPARPELVAPLDAVLDAVGWQPSSAEDLLSRTGMTLGELATHLDRLEDDGWIARRGGWYERLVSR